MLSLICKENTTLKEFTENNYAQASFAWNQLLKSKEIKVNGVKVGENARLFSGDEVRYYLTEKQASKRVYDVIYEDENVMVIDKRSGVNSEAVFADLVRKKGEGCGFIHRLDRNTEGLMIFSLNDEAKKELLTAFKARTAEKIYRAICFGTPKKSTEILTAYLRKDEEKSLVRIFDAPTSGAERIVTEYALLEESGEKCKLEIRLHTGKTHQIRAHLAHVGLPIVGDMKYGDEAKNRALRLARQRLVAYSLKLFDLKFLSYLNGRAFHSRFDVELDECVEK